MVTDAGVAPGEVVLSLWHATSAVAASIAANRVMIGAACLNRAICTEGLLHSGR
jgi:hypothetical protein